MGYQCIDCVHAGQREQRAQRAQYRGAGYGTRTAAGALLGRQAVITPALIAINVLIYVITAAQASSAMENNGSGVFQAGVLWPLGIAFRDEWWRVLTSGFLHYGLLHVAMNMIALWVLGRDLELLLGKLRFSAVYLVSLLGGAASVFVFGEVNTGTAGASGAIFGLMGGIAIAVLRLRLNPTAAIGVIVLNIVLSVSIPGISLLGHLGGLVLGALGTAALLYAPEKNKARWQAGALILLAVVAIAVIVYRDVSLAGQICQAVPGAPGRVACTS